MARRAELNGIAAGLAGKFTSRYNDIDGYWALGILYKVAATANSSSISIDLLLNKVTPQFDFVRRVNGPLVEFLFVQLKKRRLEEFQVSKAIVNIKFGMDENLVDSGLRRNTRGEPYICRVVLTDDLQKDHVAVVKGWCEKHNPSREHRSTRGLY